MILNYKYEIFPNKEQMDRLNGWINLCRQTYNSALLDKTNLYKKEHKNLKRKDLQKIQTTDKKKFSFLKEVPSQPLQEVLFRLEKAFEKFFRKEALYPKLKKFKDYNSLTFTQFGMSRQNQKNKKTGKVTRQLVRRGASLGKGGKLLLSGLDAIEICFHRKLDGKVKQVIIKRENSRWFAIFSIVKWRKPQLNPPLQTAIGLDVGIQKFAVLSDGTEIENPRFLRKKEKQLKKLQRQLSKKKRGSSNWRKLGTRLRNLHVKVANQRKDFAHKISYHLSRNYTFICVEDLRIKNMVKNRHLAKSIQDAGWGQFRNFLQYKCKKNGGQLIRVAPHHTSQQCSTCKNMVKKSLSIRTHVCNNCGTVLDRDHNAAINILKAGLNHLFR